MVDFLIWLYWYFKMTKENSNNDVGDDEFDDDELSVVDEKYLMEPEYGDKRVNTDAMESETPWWADTNNNRTQLIGKLFAYSVIILLLIVGFQVLSYSGGITGDVDLSVNDSSDETIPNESDIDDSLSDAGIVSVESVDRHYVVVEEPESESIIDDLNWDGGTEEIRLYGSHIPSLSSEDVDPSRYGMDDTEEVRQCLANYGEDGEEYLENKLIGDDIDALLVEQDYIDGDDYNGTDRHYLVVSDSSVSFKLISNGYASTPSWDFDYYSDHFDEATIASENNEGLWSCGDGSPVELENM